MKLPTYIRSFLSITTVSIGIAGLANTPVKADNTLFFDGFDGPTLNPMWQASLPNASLAPYGGIGATYLGAPDYTFQTLNGYSVLVMSNNMSDLQRVGWNSGTSFDPSAFTYEVRFNTLVQSSTTSIDSFIELWILDPTNPNRYDMVTLFGASYSTYLEFAVGSTIDNTFNAQAFNYANDTWYRLVIQDLPGQNIRVSLNDDSGAELIGQTLSHDEGAYSSGFEICLSQAMHFPLSTYPSDVAVDYVRLVAIPEPDSMVLIAGALCGLAAARKWRLAQTKHSR